MVIHILDALKEFLVERDFVTQVGKLRHHLFLCLCDFSSLVRTRQTEEDTDHLVQQHPTLLKSHDCILECRSLIALRNTTDCLTLLADTLLDGREIVRRLYLAEIRSAERELTLFQQRVTYRI